METVKERQTIEPAKNSLAENGIDIGDSICDLIQDYARFVIGLGLLGALSYEAWGGAHDYHGVLATPGASAVQAIQVLVPHFYVVLLAIGVAFGLYVITRGWDRIG